MYFAWLMINGVLEQHHYDSKWQMSNHVNSLTVCGIDWRIVELQKLSLGDCKYHTIWAEGALSSLI